MPGPAPIRKVRLRPTHQAPVPAEVLPLRAAPSPGTGNNPRAELNSRAAVIPFRARSG